MSAYLTSSLSDKGIILVCLIFRLCHIFLWVPVLSLSLSPLPSFQLSLFITGISWINITKLFQKAFLNRWVGKGVVIPVNEGRHFFYTFMSSSECSSRMLRSWLHIYPFSSSGHTLFLMRGCFVVHKGEQNMSCIILCNRFLKCSENSRGWSRTVFTNSP